MADIIESEAIDVREGEVIHNDLIVINTSLATLDRISAGLADLRQSYGGVIYDVATKEGYKSAKEALAIVRAPRHETERVRKAAKRPLLDMGKRIDTEAARITEGLLEIEAPIEQQVKTEDDRRETAKREKEDAERKRIADIHERIGQIATVPALALGEPSEVIGKRIVDLEALELAEADYGDLVLQAQATKGKALGQLRDMLAKTQEAEHRRAQEAQEAAEAARQRAEREAKEAADRARRERLNSAVMSIRNIDSHLEIASSAAIRDAISAMKADPPLESAWGEDLPVMQQANADTLASLDRMLGAAERREEEEVARKEYEAELARERAEIATARAAQEAYAGRLSEISAIRHQAIIAAVGRLGVRAGGTSQCARETLAETEAWEVTEEKFGPVLLAVAQAAKHETLEQIRSILMAREVHEEEEARLAAEQAELASQREQLAAQQRQADEARIAREIEARRLETEAQLKREKEERAAALDSAASEELADESEGARQRNLAEFESVYREAHPTRMPPIVVDLTGTSEMPSDEVELTDAAAQMSTQAPVVRDHGDWWPGTDSILHTITTGHRVSHQTAVEWVLRAACELGAEAVDAA